MLGGLAGAYAWQVEPFWIEFVKKKMSVHNLPPHLEGKTVMQISDIHVGNRFDYGYLIDAFVEAQALDPDYVFYTGDYVSYESEEQIRQLQEVLAHTVKGSTATVGILGNHDYGRNWSEPEVANSIVELLNEAGVVVLRNEAQEFDGLNVIGLDDYWGTNFDPSLVMDHYDDQLPNVVLCHNPDVCDMNVWHGYQGWILAGHTHGGQCKPPFLPPPMLPVRNKKYTAGEIDLEDGRTLYINRALGHLWQIRFNVRPEITVFELTSA